MLAPPPRPPLFPYTTLFRSDVDTVERDLPKWVAAYRDADGPPDRLTVSSDAAASGPRRSEEHTSELQSRENLVCRLLLEKKKAGARHQSAGFDCGGC